jgi:hypothetical protein
MPSIPRPCQKHTTAIPKALVSQHEPRAHKRPVLKNDWSPITERGGEYLKEEVKHIITLKMLLLIIIQLK